MNFMVIIPKTYKNTYYIVIKTGRLPKQGGKEHGPNGRTDHKSRKTLNEMVISNLSDAEFKTLVIRMLKELSEDLNIKKIQSEMKGALIEIKNNLQ